MASQLQPRPAYKRSRSELSRSTTPAPVESDAEELRTHLPSFLQQNQTEIKRKFEYIQELEEARHESYLAESEPDPAHLWAQEHTVETNRRNRYIDIIPWKQSRIHLKVSEGQLDYINASPISLSRSDGSHELQFIASQGPKQLGVDHFWQMIWHECGEVAVVVMLTRLNEGTREKCFQYFPSADSPAPRPNVPGSTVPRQGLSTPGQATTPKSPNNSSARTSNTDLSTATQPTIPLKLTSDTGGEVQGSVTLIDTTWDEACQAVIRKLCLVRGDESRIVYHLLFSSWPDFGVPQGKDRAALLKLIRLSNEKNDDQQESSPRVVHCSAGVGRTGTFMALEHLLGELDHGVYDDSKSLETHESEYKPDDDEEMKTWPDPVFDTVARLREQRPVMVQGLPQFKFIYEILSEEWVKRKRKLIEDHKAMAEPSPKAVRIGQGLKKMLHLGRSSSVKSNSTGSQGALIRKTSTSPGTLEFGIVQWAMLGGLTGCLVTYLMFRWR